MSPIACRKGHDGRDSRGLRSKQVTLGKGETYIVWFDLKLKKNGSELYSIHVDHVVYI